MTDLAIIPTTAPLTQASNLVMPAVIADAGDQAARRFIEFFTANIRNPNTRAAYARAVMDFFGWCERWRRRSPPSIWKPVCDGTA